MCKGHTWSFFLPFRSRAAQDTRCFHTSTVLSLPFTLNFHTQCLLFSCLGSDTSLLVVIICLPELQITKNFCFASVQLWSDLFKNISEMSGFPNPDLDTHSSSTGQLFSRFYLLQIKIQTCHWYMAENDEITKPKMTKGHKYLLVLGQGIHSHWNTAFRKDFRCITTAIPELWTNQCEEQVLMNH